MKNSKILFLFALFCLAAVGSTGVSAQQKYQLSSKFYEVHFKGPNPWSGKHRFDNVLCLTFPRSNEAETLAYAMYNNNALYFSRAAYKDATALYAVTSTVPQGRTVDVEIGNMETQNQRTVDTYPENFKQDRVSGRLGPSLILTVRNSIEGDSGSPFPFSRSFVSRPGGGLESLSVHRLFVRGLDRIEIAGLRYFASPVTAEHEEQAISDLTELVEEAASSMQSCTAGLAPRLQ